MRAFPFSFSWEGFRFWVCRRQIFGKELASGFRVWRYRTAHSAEPEQTALLLLQCFLLGFSDDGFFYVAEFCQYRWWQSSAGGWWQSSAGTKEQKSRAR